MNSRVINLRALGRMGRGSLTKGKPMKFPYGVSDFDKLITEGHYYCDRTDRIPVLEAAGYYLLFIRPRRFGKRSPCGRKSLKNLTNSNK